MRDLPHLIYLQAFEAAARHLSFTRASQELNCTQAAISQRIRGLEHYFGRPLFHRKPNGLELSSAGAAYLPGITQALDVMDAATRGLTGRRIQQVVTISAPISFFNHILSPLLPDFAATHPEIGLRLNSSIWTDPNLDLADLSVGFTELSLLPNDASVIMPAPLQHISAAVAAETAQRRIEVQGKFMLWDLWCEASGITQKAGLPSFQVDTASTALRLVANGLGHSVVYAAYANDSVRASAIIGSEPVDVGHVLMMRLNAGRRLHKATALFIEWFAARLAGNSD